MDRSTGNLIDAVFATPGPRKRYTCPTCGAKCHLRAGERREPCFVHNSGQASADCENYHPGGDYQPGVTVRNRIGHKPPHRSPNLYLVPEEDWKLFILVPEATDRTGVVEVQGYRGTVTLPLAKLTHGGQRVQVRPQHQYYELEVRGTADIAYATRVRTPVVGLSRLGCTVFRYSPAGGRRLPDDQALYWGRGYCVVWPEGSHPDWWPKLLYRKPLRPNGPWQCYVIELPAEEDLQTQGWIERILGRAVRQALAILTLVAPAEDGRLDDESAVVPAGGDVIVGLFGEPGAYNPSLLAVEYPGAIQHVTLQGPLPVLVSLGRLAPGRTEVWLPDDPDTELSIIAVDHVNTPQPHAVMLQFADARSGQPMMAPLYSEQAANLLQQTRRGHQSFVAIAMPEPVSGAVRFRAARESGWHEVLFKWTPGGTNESHEASRIAIEHQVADEIRVRLAQRSYVVQVDFGNFGSVTVDLDAVPNSVKEAKALSPKWRRQIQWVLSLAYRMGRDASGEGIQELKRSLGREIGRFESDQDRELLISLLRRERWPAEAEPYLRALAKAVRSN